MMSPSGQRNQVWSLQFSRNPNSLAMLMLIPFVTVCLFSVSSGYHHRVDDDDNTLTITIPFATIVGKQEKVLGRSLGVFLGLPYAKPPVGELRFKPPSSVDPFHGTYDATEFRSPCPQPPYSNHQFNNTNENCLFLNIWTPFSSFKSNHLNFPSLKPVIIYIYGGGFDKGSVHELRHHGDVLSSLSDTIVVTVNHRLNILGFGYGGSDSMPGNMGVYDLIKALEWVNENIEYFGGDPDEVTIFGACSGAMAASAFMLSPIVDQKLFSRVYLASSVISPHTAIQTPEEVFKLTRAAAEVVGCKNVDDSQTDQLTEEQIACMRTVDAQTLVNASFTDAIGDLLSWKISPPFRLMYKTDFLPYSPDHLVTDKLPRRRVPILFGNEEAEDEMFTPYWPETKQEAKDLLTEMLLKAHPNTTQNQLDSLFHYYFDEVEENVLDLKQAITSAAGDYLHHCTLLLFTEAWTRNGQIAHGYLNSYVMDGLNRTERLFGTKHGDTTFQMLGKAFHEYDQFSDRDRKISEKMIQILSDFAYGKKLPWPPMLLDSSRSVLPLKWKWTKRMSTKKLFSDPKDKVCHLWGEIRNLTVY